jgi:diguanylate cyclase (GGDEF)-like protein
LILFLILGCAVSLVTFYKNSFQGLIFSIVLIASLFAAAANFIFHDIIFDFFGASLIILLSFLVMSGSKYFSIIVENVRLRRMAITDGLTGLYVFRYFEAKLNSEVRAALEARKNLSLVIFDIDYFKKFNDTYGHDAGNEVLKTFAAILAKSRHTDTVARFGGEEFVAILPTTNLEGALIYAEAIRKKVEAASCLWQEKPLKITVSAGAATLLNLPQTTAKSLITAADTALYKAKANGRNRVTA